MQLSSHRNKVIARLIKNDYFFFSGKNMTLGNAHPTTGNRDTFGHTYRFKTKAAAMFKAGNQKRGGGNHASTSKGFVFRA